MSASTVWPRTRPTTMDTKATGRTPPWVSAKVGSRAQLALGVAMAMFYLLAIGSRQDQIALAFVALSGGMAVLWPAAGLAMFAIVMPVHETEILVPIRFNAIMVGAIAMGCILRLPVDRMRFKVHPGAVLLLGYVVISAVSVVPVLTGHPTEWTPSALNLWVRLSTGVALFLSASYLFRLMPPRPILVLALFGATLTALLAIGDITNTMPFEPLTRGLVDDTESLRASGSFADPNFFGVYMATAAVFGLGVLSVAPRRLKLLLVPIVALLFVCVALSYSRTAYFGTFAGVAVLVWLRSRLAAATLLVGAGILSVTLYPAFLELRQGAALSPIDEYDMVFSQDTRTTIAAAALAMFVAFPVFGIGFGSFQFVSSSYVRGGAPDSTYSHNQYLNILAEQGVVGIVLVAGILVLLTSALRQSRSPLRATAMAMLATYLVASIFLHTATIFQSSSLMWLVMAAALAPGPRRAEHVMGV